MEKKYASQYRNEGFLSPARRIYSSLLDALLMTVVSFCLLLASNAIVGNIPAYSNQIEAINSLRIDMYQIQEETKLFEFERKENGEKDYDKLVSQNDVFKKYVLSNVLYSYDLNKTDWDAKYVKETDNPYTLKDRYDLGSASYSNDYLAYFFVDYAEKYNENNNLFSLADNETYIAHYKTLLKNYSKGADWEYYEGEDTLPSLKMDYAYTLYRYVFFEEGGQSGLNSYNFLISQYQGVFEYAEDVLFHSERYQAIYQLYKEHYASCSRIVSLFSFVSYVITFLLCYFLPSLLFKEGQTIGMFVFKAAVINKDGLEVSKGEILLRNLVSFFSCFPVMLFSCFFAGGLNSGWMYPLISVNGIGLSFFNITIVLFAVSIANALFMLIRKDRRSLTELASSTVVIDKRYYQDHRSMDEKVQQEQKEKEMTKNVILDTPYFDSTSFNNTERKKSLEKDQENKK